MQKINYFKIILIVSFIFLFSSCKKEVFTEEVINTTDICSVYVNSNPQGAKIYIDNKYTGYNTPDTVKWLSESQHKITLKFTLIKDTSVLLQTQASLLKSLYIDYFASPRNYGSIACESVPTNASISLNNNKLSQTTPYNIPYLFPGYYNVKFGYPGYRDDSLLVTVYGGSGSYLRLSLQDTSVWVDYRINDSNIPSNKIVTLKSDSKNNIWAGTLDCGIVRFTKGKFAIYNTSNSGLPYDFTTCLEIDKNDNIWIGTINGLGRFDGIHWTVFKTSNSRLPDNYISSIYSDADGNTWVGTQKGLARIAGNDMYVYNAQTSPMLQNYISGITKDTKGNLWIASVGGVSELSNGIWKTYTRSSDGLDGFDAGNIAADLEGNIWCSFPENPKSGIAGGLMKFEGSNWRELNVPSIPKGRIQSIYVDSKGYKWIASSNGFLLIKTDNSQTLYKNTSYAMWSFDVRGFTIDLNNNAWIALFGGGILKWKLPYN